MFLQYSLAREGILHQYTLQRWEVVFQRFSQREMFVYFLLLRSAERIDCSLCSKKGMPFSSTSAC